MQAKSVVHPKAVAARLEQARRDRGVRKNEVAAAAAMTPSTYSQWISATTESYDAEKLLRTCRFLGVRIEWVLFGEEPMRVEPVGELVRELLADAPEAPVNESLNFMAYQLSRSIADDPAKLGKYLKMIDEIVSRKRNL